MSFSTLTGVTWKVWRSFLKICRWFLLKMSSNQNHCCPNGDVYSSSNPMEAKEPLQNASDGKWRRGLVFLWLLVAFFVFIWVLTSLNDGNLCREVETPLTSEDNTQDTLESCNASMEKITSLACCRELGRRMPPRRTIICALKMLGFENQIFHRQCELGTENVESSAHCPSIEQANAYCLGLPSSEETSASFIANTTFSSVSSTHPCCKEVKSMRPLTGVCCLNSSSGM